MRVGYWFRRALTWALPLWVAAEGLLPNEELVAEAHWDYIEKLEALRQRPLDLNRATPQALAQLLTPNQIQQLVAHRKAYGPLLSIYELQTIPGFELAQCEQFKPFITVQDTYGATSLLPHYQAWIRTERTKPLAQGYDKNDANRPNSYVGNPWRVRHKALLQLGPYGQVGYSVEKAAGEAWCWDSHSRRYGPGLWQGHVQLDKHGHWPVLILGDYQMGYGEGLVSHAGWHSYRGAAPVKIMCTNNQGLRPVYGFDRKRYFRGGALHWMWLHTFVTAGYSYRALDGKLKGSTPDELHVLRFPEDQPACTPKAIEQRAQVAQQVWMGALGYTHAYGKFGVQCLHTRYSMPIRPPQAGEKWYRPARDYTARGQRFIHESLFFNWLFGPTHWFGEIAQCHTDCTLPNKLALSTQWHDNKAMVLGVAGSLGPRWDVTLALRHHGVQYHTPHGQTLKAHGPTPHNEQGTYLGLRYCWPKKWTCEGYYDFHYCPAPRWNVYRASHGHAWRIHFAYPFTRTADLSITSGATYQQVHAPATAITKRKDQPLVYMSRHSSKIRFKYPLGHVHWSAISALHHCYHLEKKPIQGLAIVQSLQYKPYDWRVQLQLVGFNSPAYATRLYGQEPGVRYQFRQIQYHGIGWRGTLVLAYQWYAKCWLEVKYAYTHYTDGRHTMGSGAEKRLGHQRQDFTLQLRCVW